MLDLGGIMFSSVIMLFVIVRAVQLDRIIPWFQRKSTITEPQAVKGRGKQNLRPWQRG